MSHASFSTEWLGLREPVDHQSRASELLEPLRAWCRSAGVTRIVDLGSGTGSNVRYLAPRLFPPREGREESKPVPPSGATNDEVIRWRLVDHDTMLLERALARGIGDAASVEARHTLRAVVDDLRTDGLREIAGAQLVTASALLDLVSEAWLEGMVEACCSNGAAALFALSYDGRVRWVPEHPLDALVLDAVNAHQRLDKGLGPALGPDAAPRAEQLFREAGWQTRQVSSPWRLGPEDRPMVRLLLRGWVDAAVELRPRLADSVREWAADRMALLEGDEGFSVTVGHLDLLALPPETAPCTEPGAS